MPKLKLPRKSTHIDMTAMCDVAFLLLTFFMLATKFRPDEPVTVVTPSSISEIPLPENDVMLLTVDPTGRVFFSIDNKLMRQDLIDRVDEYKSLGLNQQEKYNFSIGSSIGVPFNQLKSYLDLPPDEASRAEKAAPGVPVDTSGDMNTNELSTWIVNARNANPKLRICIKADSDTPYPDIKKIISTLEKLKIFRFNLITNLKETPRGTPAYEEKFAKSEKG